MKEITKYRILTFLRYLGDSLFYPFFSLFLQNQGLVEGKIGFILSISPLIGIITNPIYTKICKNYTITKNILGIVSIIEALLIASISFFSNFYIIGGITLLIALFGSCHYGLMDSLITIFASNENANYSSIRLFGSSAYIIGTILGGILINYFSFSLCFMASCILFIVSGIIYHLIKPINYNKESKETVKLQVIFKNKEFVLFLILYTILMGTTNAGDNFFSVYLKSRGIGSTEYGFINAYYVIIEVVLLLIFTKNAKKINNNLLLVIGAASLSVRMFINGIYAPLFLVIVSAGLRGVTYAILLHVSFQMVLTIVGEKKATTGIMLITLGQAIFVLIFNNINGNLIEKTNTYKYYYLLMLFFAISSLVLSLYRFILKKNKKYLE